MLTFCSASIVPRAEEASAFMELTSGVLLLDEMSADGAANAEKTAAAAMVEQMSFLTFSMM
jgi:hypothetical protein